MNDKNYKQKILARSKEIAHAVKNGNYLPPAVDMNQVWFPDRGTIKKDEKAIKRLFKKDSED